MSITEVKGYFVQTKVVFTLVSAEACVDGRLRLTLNALSGEECQLDVDETWTFADVGKRILEMCGLRKAVAKILTNDGLTLARKSKVSSLAIESAFSSCAVDENDVHSVR